MFLTEVDQVPVESLPIEEFRAHLRLGSGFAEDSLQDGVLESYLRAAIAAIEGRTGVMLLQREFRWDVTDWQDTVVQRVPVGPLRRLVSAFIVDANGVVTEQIEIETLQVRADPFRPVVTSLSGSFPSVPDNGHVEIHLIAGQGSVWGEIAPDLAQAVLLMAAHFYEYRHDVALGRGCTPFGVTALIERYRPIRVGFGG